MSYKAKPNWPPTWSWIEGESNKRPKGEVGILKDVRTSATRPTHAFFLTMEYEGSRYLGSLVFDDSSFCAFVMELLRAHYGESIEKIGGLPVD